jgi:uncharacterized Tic20 family protein
VEQEIIKEEKGYSPETILNAAAAIGSLMWVGGVIVPVLLYFGLWEGKKEVRETVFKIVDFQILIFVVNLVLSVVLLKSITVIDIERSIVALDALTHFATFLTLLGFALPATNALRSVKNKKAFYPLFIPKIAKKMFASFGSSVT